jgi:hypothetical protein
LPMNGLTVAQAIGHGYTPPATGPEFNIFVLLQTSGPSSTPTFTRTATRTATSTAVVATSTRTPTRTATNTPTRTATNTPTRTPSPQATSTVQSQPSATVMATTTGIATVQSTATSAAMTATPIATPGGSTPTPAATSTPAEATPTRTHTSVATSTPVYSATQRPNTPVPTASAVSTTSAPTPTTCSITFTDVPPSNPFYVYVRCLACRGIIGGYPNGTFLPNDPISRGQLSKVVSASAGFNEDPGPQLFQDVPASNPFFVWINRLANRGIMGGYGCGHAPNEPCIPPQNRPYFRASNNSSRGQIAKIISNAAGYSDVPGTQTFEDVPPSQTFYLWIERLAWRGIMGGYPCGGIGEPCGPGSRPYFRPAASATRGQTTKIVANAFFPQCSP